MRWPLQPLQPLRKTQLQPPFGGSVDLLCHPWVTTTNLSYRFPIFETSAVALCGTTGNLYRGSLASRLIRINPCSNPHWNLNVVLSLCFFFPLLAFQTHLDCYFPFLRFSCLRCFRILALKPSMAGRSIAPPRLRPTVAWPAGGNGRRCFSRDAWWCYWLFWSQHQGDRL